MRWFLVKRRGGVVAIFFQALAKELAGAILGDGGGVDESNAPTAVWTRFGCLMGVCCSTFEHKFSKLEAQPTAVTI